MGIWGFGGDYHTNPHKNSSAKQGGDEISGRAFELIHGRQYKLELAGNQALSTGISIIAQPRKTEHADEDMHLHVKAQSRDDSFFTFLFL